MILMLPASIDIANVDPAVIPSEWRIFDGMTICPFFDTVTKVISSPFSLTYRGKLSGYERGILSLFRVTCSTMFATYKLCICMHRNT